MRSGRPVQAEIDLSAVESNARTVKKLIGPECQLMAVVKANGYGLGARWTLRLRDRFQPGRGDRNASRSREKLPVFCLQSGP